MIICYQGVSRSLAQTEYAAEVCILEHNHFIHSVLAGRRATRQTSFFPFGVKQEMPTYQYHCEKCDKSFEITATIAERDAKKFSCPKCKSKKVKQQLTDFAPSTSKHIVR
jgi:putative FmdB family regulatory protein